MSFSYLCQKVLKNLITTIARKWESPQIVVFRLSRLVSRQHLSSDNPALKGPIFCQKRELCTFDDNNKKAASNKCKLLFLMWGWNMLEKSVEGQNWIKNWLVWSRQQMKVRHDESWSCKGWQEAHVLIHLPQSDYLLHKIS